MLLAFEGRDRCLFQLLYTLSSVQFVVVVFVWNALTRS